MAKEDVKKDEKQCCKKRNLVIDGFKMGFGIYVAFLTGTLILAALTAGIWWVVLITR